MEKTLRKQGKGMRKGFLTFDAATGIVLASVLIGLIIFGAYRVQNLKNSQRLAEANSLLGTYMAKVSAVCRENPSYSTTEQEKLGNDEFTVSAQCRQINHSLVEVNIEVKGEGVDLKGKTYVSK